MTFRLGLAWGEEVGDIRIDAAVHVQPRPSLGLDRNYHMHNDWPISVHSGSIIEFSSGMIKLHARNWELQHSMILRRCQVLGMRGGVSAYELQVTTLYLI